MDISLLNKNFGSSSANNEKYSELIKSFEEIGRQLGGWKKGLEIKNSQFN